MVRSMLKDAKLGATFWIEVMKIIVYLLNRELINALTRMTPNKSWSRVKLSISHIQVFGCTTYIHIPKVKRTKLEDKSLRCILLGYSTKSKGYIIMDPTTWNIYMRKYIIFDDTSDPPTSPLAIEPDSYLVIIPNYEDCGREVVLAMNFSLDYLKIPT